MLMLEDRDEGNAQAIDHDLALFAEIHRDPTAYVGLHLPDPPIGPVRMADQHAGFQYRVQIVHSPLLECCMTEINATLAALVGSRLCHDLISPVGAIQNGLELLALSGLAQDVPEMALIEDSCTSAAARIRFFRVAFGSAASDQMMSRREIAATLNGIAKGTKLSGEWLPEGDQPREAVQLAFLAYLCCEVALPLGGTVRIDQQAGSWALTATGRRVVLDETTWQHLVGPTDLTDVTPDRVQFVMLSVLARAQGRSLHVSSSDSDLRMAIQ